MSITSMFSSGTCNGPEDEMQDKVRPAAVAGSFYPADRNALLTEVKGFFRPFEGQSAPSEDVQAVIVPHAGYVFSGQVAATAFAQIDRKKHFDHIFLIGPSHHVYTGDASINNWYDFYETPLGRSPVDRKLCDKLLRDHDCFSYTSKAHSAEHCLEVQLPFLQYWLKEPAPIVPIIISTESMEVIRKVAEALQPYFNDKNLFVISSDFSHYPDYEDAQRVDGKTAEAVETGLLDTFRRAIRKNESLGIPNLATSACGEHAIDVLMMLTAGSDRYEYRHLVYRNSGDVRGMEKNEVVGYHAFAIIRRAADHDSSFVLTGEEKHTLLHIARESILSRLHDEASVKIDSTKLTPSLLLKCGAFVTLTKDDQLRGCIGHFGSDTPLFRVVEEMAQAAAFEDPRFYAVREPEMKDITLEISVLTPLKKIRDISEFQLGRDGIYIRKGNRSGTFLPQVADETHWSKEEFLGHCARDKAGLDWDGWRSADLFTYQAIIFKEGSETE